MQIGGYRLRQHIRLLAPLFALLAGVWALRWILGSIEAMRWTGWRGAMAHHWR